MNVMTPALFLTSILTFLWPQLRGTGGLLYRASLGGFVALLSAPMIALGDSTDVGRHTGTYLTVLSLFSPAGPPISGAIYHTTGGYSIVGIYAGWFSLFFFFFSPSLSEP
jgi:MCP family monocarboxylic acid transporter-like MFS transporter 10